MKYRDELIRSMTMLGEHPDTVFLGQAVETEGTSMSSTLRGIPKEKLLEFPVAEALQMGVTNGLALDGRIPVSIFPRWNFLLLATDQLVNHLDKFPEYSGYPTKVIVRVGIGSEKPLHPQCQHVGDFTDAFRLLLKNIEVIRLDEPGQIFPAYQKALERRDGRSTILVEWSDYYSQK